MTKKKDIPLLGKQVKLTIEIPLWVLDELAAGLRFRASFHEKSKRETIGRKLRAYAKQLEDKAK